MNAFNARITNYIDGKGLNTIAAMNSKYAADPNWGAGVSAASGIPINAPLDTSNAGQMQALQAGIIKQETGMSPANFGISASTDSGASPNQSYVTAAPTDASGSPSSQSLFPGSGFDDSAGTGPFSVDGPNVDSVGGASSSPVGVADSTGNIGSIGSNSLGQFGSSVPPSVAQIAGVSPAASQTLASGASQVSGSATAGVGAAAAAAAAGGGLPEFITNASGVGAAGLAGVQQAVGGVGTSINNAATAAAQTDTSLVGSLETAATDLFVRFGFVLVGLLLIGGAFLFFDLDRGNKIDILPVPT